MERNPSKATERFFEESEGLVDSCRTHGREKESKTMHIESDGENNASTDLQSAFRTN